MHPNFGRTHHSVHRSGSVLNKIRNIVWIQIEISSLKPTDDWILFLFLKRNYFGYSQLGLLHRFPFSDSIERFQNIPNTQHVIR